MARIAGLIDNHRREVSEQRVRDMLLPMQQVDWLADVCSTGKVVLGWTGRPATNLATSGEVVVVLDGFVYNREDWTSRMSDAQLLLDLYLKYGFEGALQKINGDFSVALYDEKTETLWLGRDRFGVKPLYYASKGKFFACPDAHFR